MREYSFEESGKKGGGGGERDIVGRAKLRRDLGAPPADQISNHHHHLLHRVFSRSCSIIPVHHWGILPLIMNTTRPLQRLARVVGRQTVKPALLSRSFTSSVPTLSGARSPRAWTPTPFVIETVVSVHILSYDRCMSILTGYREEDGTHVRLLLRPQYLTIAN